MHFSQSKHLSDVDASEPICSIRRHVVGLISHRLDEPDISYTTY